MSKIREIRITGPALKVLTLFLECHPEKLSGADIINQKKLLSGTLYPLLDRLSVAGWISGEWEKIEPSEVGRPRRRMYKLTADGVHCASHAVQEHGISVKKKLGGGETATAREEWLPYL